MRAAQKRSAMVVAAASLAAWARPATTKTSADKPPLRWVRPFVAVNGAIVAVAVAAAWLERQLRGAAPPSLARAYAACVVACACRDAAVVLFLELATRGRERIGGRAPPPAAARRSAWLKLCFVAAPVDGAVLLAARAAGLVAAAGARSGPAAFVAVSFCFEVAFDLGHYGAHRACHAAGGGALARFLRRSHATHHGAHGAHGLGPVLAYEQSPTDLVACNALPALAALAALAAARGRPLAAGDAALLWAYKAYVEVAGHCGCHSDATSFPQCVWLPRLLGIALTTRDHDAHHTRPKACNFAKRFTLWDRAFGTLAPR
jgi:sterol desaturase/sphingolipid hydroxylase (fatty acid hydroxylase superfamily)